jgi:hypothetical protein
MANDTQRQPPRRLAAGHDNDPGYPQGAGLPKRPWLLVGAAALVMLWIGFLALMAWHG